MRGFKTLERNFQVRFGEIDLVMLDGETLVFAEVRYRENNRHGTGADSVTRAKQRRIVSAAQSPGSAPAMQVRRHFNRK
jgi:putative endonuclease